MNKLFISLILGLMLFPLTPYVYAEEVVPEPEIDILCEDDGNPVTPEEDEECTVTPSDTAPLFNEEDFPNFDLKPGDEFFRKIRVTNNRETPCYFTLIDARSTFDTEVTPGNYFSQRLMTEIKDDEGQTTSLISFWNLFAMLPETPLYVTTLDPLESQDIEWWVKFDKNAGNEYQLAKLVFDFDWNFACGEEPGFTQLFIEKTNDKLGVVQEPGDEVKYTIFVTASELNPVFNVIVMDLPPGGFVYRGGTWTANSDIRGNLKSLGVTTEPNYHSPGTWQLGNMQPGEVVTLTYVTDIDEDTQSGIYPDIAWTEGTALSDPASTRVIGNEATGFFVGTAAEIAVNISPDVEVETNEKEVEEEGEVLGASTLPATGANPIYAIIVWAFLISGGLFIMLGLTVNYFKSKKRAVPQLVIFAVTGIIYSAISAVYAADPNLLIRLQEPETPNTEDTLLINFVALDTENRAVTVKCFKKGPGEAAFSQFGSNIALPAGGDDGYCVASPSILSAKGMYDFYASADSGAGEVLSQVVTFDYDSDKPGKPHDLEKDKNGSCKYDISLKTANDGGDTTRVEIYRSDEKEFEANSSTRIRDISAGSNETIEFTDDKPNCGKTYYYAAIAFDDVGNRSAVEVEDIEVKVTVSSSETTQTSQQTAEGGSPFGAILTSIETEGPEGEGGEATVTVPETTPEGTEETTDETGEVLGEQGTNLLAWLSQNQKYLWPGLILLIIFVLLYARSKNKN